MHPAAAIEVRTFKRMWARVFVEPHDTLAELTTFTFSDGEGTEYQATMSLDNLELLARRIADRIEQVSEFIAGDEAATTVVEVRSA